MLLWPTGWVWPDGTHGVLYELGGDTVYRYGLGPTWYAAVTGATLGADRTRPVATQLAPSNDLLVAWMDGATCKCKRLRYAGSTYGGVSTEYTIAASMERPGSIDQLPDGRLVFVGENAAGVGYSLSSDDGATWSEFTALVAGAAYPAACRLGASQDLLLAYADQPWGEATVSVCRLAWDGSAYAVAAGSTVTALELGGVGQHPMDYLNSVDAIFERASGVPVLLLSLFNRLTGTVGYYSALIMQSDDGGTTWTERYSQALDRKLQNAQGPRRGGMQEWSPSLRRQRGNRACARHSRRRAWAARTSMPTYSRRTTQPMYCPQRMTRHGRSCRWATLRH